MVASRLNPEIQYRDINDGDFGPISATDRAHRSALYELKLPFTGKRKYLVAVGKANFEYSSAYGIIYVRIYLVKRGKVVGSIGIYEFDKHQFTTKFDDKKDLMIDDQTPIIYPSITADLLETLHAEMDEDDLEEPTNKQVVELEDSEDEEDDTFTTAIPNKDKSDKDKSDKDKSDKDKSDKDKSDKDKSDKDKSDKDKSDGEVLTRDNIFKCVYPAPKRVPLGSSSENQSIESQRREAKRARDEYSAVEQMGSADNWIQKLMRSKHYQIIENAGEGDCLFYVIVEAYREIGCNTSVAKLRELLSQKADRSQFDNLRVLYASLSGEVEQNEAKMKKLDTHYKVMRDQAKQQTKKSEITKLIDLAKENRNEYAKHVKSLEMAKQLVSEFQYMKHITTLDEYRDFIRTASCWADEWAISVLEQTLAMKLIILKDSADKDDVIQCQETEASRNPTKHYILVEYVGENHYRLVTFMGRKIFSFSEIPFDVKMLVVNKCMEKSGVGFINIPDFRQFQQDLGIESAATLYEEESSDSKEELPADLYEDAVVFRFHADSDETKKPGEVNGEKMPKKRAGEFADLATRTNWRQQLDDDWVGAPFTLDSSVPGAKSLRWASVTHYVSAAPLAEIDSDGYLAFSLDSGSALGKSVQAAKESVMKKGKKEGKYYAKVEKLREDDPTAFNNLLENARKRALLAKFSQNANLTTTLGMTKKAQLLHFVRGNPPISDTLLMLVRRKVATI